MKKMTLIFLIVLSASSYGATIENFKSLISVGKKVTKKTLSKKCNPFQDRNCIKHLK